jgi:hypothetical protein
VKIALVAPLVTAIREPQLGGSQAMVADLATGLSERGHEGVVARKRVSHSKTVRRADGAGCGGQRNDPSDLPPCPAAASKLCSLAVEPILDILSDRL